MATHALGYAPEDPVSLVEACRKAIEWILVTHTARGRLLARPWINHPYVEEEITLIEEELLPAMALFFADEADVGMTRLEASDAAAAEALVLDQHSGRRVHAVDGALVSEENRARLLAAWMRG